MGQTKKHSMKIAMVSIFIEDPTKAFNQYTDVLGFEEVIYSPENYIAIIKSPLDRNGVNILLEPTDPGGLEIAKKYRNELYNSGIPVITLSAIDIQKTLEELKNKGVKFKSDPVETAYGYEAIFDDAHGNYIQLIQLK